MNISKVFYKIYPKEEQRGNTVALCSVYFDDVFAIHGTFILHNSDDSLSVVCPYTRDKYGNKVEKNLYHPIDTQFRHYFDATILEGYFQCKERGHSTFYPTESFVQS